MRIAKREMGKQGRYTWFEIEIAERDYKECISWCKANITSWTTRPIYRETFMDSFTAIAMLVITNEEEYVKAVLRWG